LGYHHHSNFVSLTLNAGYISNALTAYTVTPKEKWLDKTATMIAMKIASDARAGTSKPQT